MPRAADMGFCGYYGLANQTSAFSNAGFCSRRAFQFLAFVLNSAKQENRNRDEINFAFFFF